MAWETVKLLGEGPVRTLLLNRPRVHNAISTQMLVEVQEACAALEAAGDCRALILRGEGPSFSSGADLKEGGTHGSSTAARVHRARMGERAMDALTGLRPITIAAVHGHAIGGGACLAAACDFRVGAAGAQVSVREVSLGLSLSWHAIAPFVHLLGPARAKEMILFGGTYDAETLQAWGFFNQVAPDDGVVDAAERLAEQAAARPPIPMQMTKASINALVKAQDAAVLHLDAFGVALAGGSRDATRARDAFFAGEAGDYEFD